MLIISKNNLAKEQENEKRKNSKICLEIALIILDLVSCNSSYLEMLNQFSPHSRLLAWMLYFAV